MPGSEMGENVPSWKSVQSPECLERSLGRSGKGRARSPELLFRKLCGGLKSILKTGKESLKDLC